MTKYPKLKTVFYFIALLGFVVGMSMVSTRMWGDKPEKLPKPEKLVIESEMTIRQFGQANALPEKVLKGIFDLEAQADLEKRVDTYGTPVQINALVTKKLALAAEDASKNWFKIPLKFALWFIFLASVFLYYKKRKMASADRNRILLASLVIFGVALSSDPGPMGTVKDAIYLFGSAHAIFPPRMVALSIFLVIVFLANKYICGWGCQAGTLQDLIFRINRTGRMQAVIGRQVKLPFALTNTIRIIFFCAFTGVALLWGIDAIDPIDPFKIYKPAHLGMAGGIFVGILMLASLFIYRPWCHLLCPFGLVGWIVEKVSRVRISVDYETCIACGKCVSACPSTVMGAILEGKKNVPDCFACYTCRDVCPTSSILFSTRKRTSPPADYFAKKGKLSSGRKP